MPEFIVKKPISRNEKEYQPGAVMWLRPGEEKDLLAGGAIEPRAPRNYVFSIPDPTTSDAGGSPGS